MAQTNSSSTETTNAINAIRPVSPNEVYANRGVIMSVVKKYKWDFHSAEDLVQEVVIKCWNDPKVRFNPQKGTLVGYLARIASNTAVDMWRRDRDIPVPTDPTEMVNLLDAEGPDMGDDELLKERRKLLKRGIQEMYRKYPSKTGNDAFVLFALKGMSAKNAAKKLGVEERFVNVSVHRGMERLKHIIHQLELDDNRRDAC